MARTADDGPLGCSASAAQGNEAEKRIAFANTFRLLQRRIDVFASLPVASLERLKLQKRSTKSGVWPKRRRKHLERSPSLQTIEAEASCGRPLR
jgi:hypothetical protein